MEKPEGDEQKERAAGRNEVGPSAAHTEADGTVMDSGPGKRTHPVPRTRKSSLNISAPRYSHM